jgi:trimeric autotransporter adhesin
MPSLNFILTGRDELSRVLDRAGDASDRLARRLARMNQDSKAGGKALEELKKSALLLAPAAIPAAASLAPIAAGAGTVAVAVAAMGAALVPQISALSDAADAQKKYDDAVKKNGKTSQQAVQAQILYAETVAKMPPATREAAAAVGVLKDNYKAWSDSLAGDTMRPFIKGVELTNALIPKTTGLVKAASTEADRFVTIVGGEMASPGLDRLNSEFTGFAQKTLRSVNNEIVHLLNASQGKDFGGPAREFMDWAKAQGPTVASVLTSVATALVHVLQAGSDVGVGLLQVVEVVAKLVGAVPPEAIALFLQLAFALKVTKTAALGLAAGRTAVAAFATQIVAMRTAAAGTPGALAGARAAIGALSLSAKAAVAGTGIGLLVILLTSLSQRSKQAPPDVDKLTNSLKQLGSTGQVTGEASRAFGKDLSGLYGKIRSLTDPSTTDKVQQFLVGWTGWDSTPVKDAKDNIDSVDKALASLVQNGQSDLAASALKRLTAEYGKGGRDTSKFTSSLDDYKDALSDSRFEQQLAADSMGVFGAQAQSVQAKLDAQKRSTDGLRQSIQALNDAQRQGLGGMIGFEASIDAAAKAAKENAGSLHMVNGQLDLSSPKAQAAATALNDLAAKTDEAAASARQSNASWETVNGIYARGRSQLIKTAEAMGLTKTQAKALADQILKTPDKAARIRMETEDATRDLDAFNAKLRGSPGAKSVTLKTISSAAEAVLKSFGYKVTHLPNGKVKITAAGGQALGVIGNVAGAISALHDRHITLTTEHRQIYTGRGGRGPNAYASGGTPKAGELAMVGEEGPELVVFGQAARVFDAKTTKGLMSGTASAGRAAGQGLAVGLGSTGGVYSAARVMAGAVTAGISDELEIRSPSRKTKALAKDIGNGLIVGLTGTRAKIKSTAKDLATDIRTAFSGKKESGLLKMVDKDTKKLLALADKRDKIAAKIAEAKSYASDVTKTARSSAGLSSLGMSPEDVTAGGIKAGLAQKLSQIKQFSTYISMLAKRGLNKGLLRQILDMGPVDGYAYASALVGADKNTFSAINKTQAGIDKESKKLGNKGADILYDSGKNASKGFLTGLLSEEKNLEKTMEKLAKSMQKSLRKALGIKSPATKVIPDGINTARGVAKGVLAGLPYVDRAMETMAGRMTGWASTSPVAGRAAAAASSGSGGMVVHVTINGAVDPYATARELDKLLAKYRRGRGGAAYSFA